MKATFNNIVENLVKVLTDKVESAQYYSENEQYTGICGWCGIMSPESRPGRTSPSLTSHSTMESTCSR